VLATDQRTDNLVGEDGKTQVRTFSNVTIEATPKMAEQVAVAQTLGSLSLSLRSIADNSAELEEAIASGAVRVPNGNDPKAEKAMMVRLASQPSAGASSYQTGADVSRYQRSSVPGKPAESVGAMGVQGGMPVPVGPSATTAVVAQGPVVRVARGNAMTVVPVGGKN
jgi:pilus assembly protein CpaB